MSRVPNRVNVESSRLARDNVRSESSNIDNPRLLEVDKKNFAGLDSTERPKGIEDPKNFASQGSPTISLVDRVRKHFARILDRESRVLKSTIFQRDKVLLSCSTCRREILKEGRGSEARMETI